MENYWEMLKLNLNFIYFFKHAIIINDALVDCKKIKYTYLFFLRN